MSMGVNGDGSVWHIKLINKTIIKYRNKGFVYDKKNN